ncbi:MobV family relaxase [Plesiomonas shigelloides]|uniref:MobV family relaxase n=1 Tax=Plesiomonas shigelloides TaxID=703 RepID=UPI001261D716|nr:MobV family relaxase [Plesiomonas shigelloides]KAB7693116.1 plasmid recombination enzyme [Plesiomonas shigelloides]
MANMAIMRCKKLVSMGSVASALQHCYRERETPNAASAKTPQNEHRESKSTDEAMGRIRGLLPEKRRKDAVLAVEYVMSASPEWWQGASKQQQDEFFNRAHNWLAKKYGADRVVTASVHRDETSPHLSAFVVPLTQDGRLSAKDFIGNRTKMRDDQTSFADAVQDLGLHRGIEGSKAKHQTIQNYYSNLKKEHRDEVNISPKMLEPKVLNKSFFSTTYESVEDVAERVTKRINKSIEGTVAKARQSAQNERRAKQMADTMSQQQERIQTLTDAFKGLSKDQVDQVLGFAKALQERNREEEREALLERRKRQRQRANKSPGIEL